MLLCFSTLSYDERVSLDPERELLQGLGRRPEDNAAREVVGPAVAGTEQYLFVFLIINKTPEMRADPGKNNKPPVRPINDNTGRIVKNYFLRIAGRNISFAQDQRLRTCFSGGG